MTTRNYLSAAATAKLLRQALKETFSSKFSVRSHTYAGGASIDVRWTDGPTESAVEAVTSMFEGGYFDGMIDYKGSRYHRLDGQPVQFGADFIFTDREYTDAAVGAALDAVGAPAAVTEREFRLGLAPREAHRWLAEQSFYLGDVRPSATLKRVQFDGDDGYGAGTVGPDPEHPDGGNGYPSLRRA